jgi:hypothetical protein
MPGFLFRRFLTRYNPTGMRETHAKNACGMRVFTRAPRLKKAAEYAVDQR